MTVPVFQIPIAGQHDRHYDRSGLLEWTWRDDAFVLFKGGCAVAWIVQTDEPEPWRVWIIDRHLPYADSYNGRHFAGIDEAKAWVEAWTVREGLTPCQ